MSHDEAVLKELSAVIRADIATECAGYLTLDRIHAAAVRSMRTLMFDPAAGVRISGDLKHVEIVPPRRPA